MYFRREDIDNVSVEDPVMRRFFFHLESFPDDNATWKKCFFSRETGG